MENTKIHHITGEILYRDVKQAEYTYKEKRITVDQPGWYPKRDDYTDDDVILSQDDMAATDYALEIMKERHERYLAEQNQELGNVAFA
ncbi:MAG: hypothetical protein IKT98_10615 [Selenomonadaceae bacterium]|nr:hypothetical protein [Selenomonadaceae bacterium]